MHGFWVHGPEGSFTVEAVCHQLIEDHIVVKAHPKHKETQGHHDAIYLINRTLFKLVLSQNPPQIAKRSTQLSDTCELRHASKEASSGAREGASYDTQGVVKVRLNH